MIKRILYIGACFGLSHGWDNWDSKILCFGDSYSIRELKMPSIKYSNRMLTQQGAVEIYLLIRAELHKKYGQLVAKGNLPAFNYAVPLPWG